MGRRFPLEKSYSLIPEVSAKPLYARQLRLTSADGIW
jgi:hypothetical protein